MDPKVLPVSAELSVIQAIKASRAPLVLSLLQASKASRDPQVLPVLPVRQVKMAATVTRVSSEIRDLTAIAA